MIGDLDLPCIPIDVYGLFARFDVTRDDVVLLELVHLSWIIGVRTVPAHMIAEVLELLALFICEWWARVEAARLPIMPCVLFREAEPESWT